MINVDELKDHIYDVVGAIYEVHSYLGPGLNEIVYQEGLEKELSLQNIEFVREATFHPFYKGEKMKAEYRLDFLCKEDIVVELKSVTELIDVHRAQLFNYLRLTEASCGILVNFAPKSCVIERYFYDCKSQLMYSSDGEVLRRMNKYN